MGVLKCEEVTRWIEETVETPLEQWVERQEERCEESECNWWVLCANKLICWLVVISVIVITWVTETILKPVVTLVCHTISSSVGNVIDLFFPNYWKRYDVHIHLFTVGSVAIYGMSAFIDLVQELFRDHSPTNGSSPTDQQEAGDDLDILEQILSKLNTATIWTQEDSLAVFRYLRGVLDYRYKVAPLMLDLTYCTDEDGLLCLIQRFQEAVGMLARWTDTIAGPHGIRVRSELERFHREMLELVQIPFGGFDGPFGFNPVGFYGQASQLIEVQHRYPHLVFPFFSVDPRRPEILNYVKTVVGPDKSFYGIKLYTPLGYSPTDPVLFGTPKESDCIYKYCEEYGIPITAHCSPTGFGTIARSAHICGYIYIPEEWEIRIDGKLESGELLLDVDGVVEFNRRLDNMDLAIDAIDAIMEERSRILNHPDIWKKVLDKFSLLRLNLAHFGGRNEMKAYVENPTPQDDETRPWTYIIAQDLMVPTYPNLYADMAYQDGYDTVRAFKDTIFDEELTDYKKSRIMYGSDFPMLTLKRASLLDYERQHREIFGDAEFNRLTIDNPKRFLQV